MYDLINRCRVHSSCLEAHVSHGGVAKLATLLSGSKCVPDSRVAKLQAKLLCVLCHCVVTKIESHINIFSLALPSSYE